jgi:hypothetical protein
VLLNIAVVRNFEVMLDNADPICVELLNNVRKVGGLAYFFAEFFFSI